MNETELKYFRDSWKPDYSKFNYSGWALLDKIKDITGDDHFMLRRNIFFSHIMYGLVVENIQRYDII